MRYLIPRLSKSRTGYNFRARPFPILVILSNWGTCVISPDPEKVNLVARARVNKFLGPPESTPIAIFAHDRFQY